MSTPSTASLSLLDKFNLTPACVPWPSAAGVRFCAGPMADIDGDGYEEVLAMVPDPTGLSAARLGVLSFMDLTQMAPEWVDAPNPVQMVATANTQLSALPPSTAPIGAAYTGNVTGGEQANLIVFDGVDLTLSGWNSVTGMQPVFATSGGMLACSGSTAMFKLTGGPRIVVMDVDGDGLDEIVIATLTGLAVAKYDSSTSPALACIWVGSPEDGWTSPGFLQLWACQVAGTNQVLAYNQMYSLLLLTWSDGQLQPAWQSDGPTIQSGNDTGVVLEFNQLTQTATTPQFFIGDFDGDGNDEVLVYGWNNMPEVAGAQLALWMLSWSNDALVVEGYATFVPGGTGWQVGPANLQAGVFAGSANAVLVVADELGNLNMINWSNEDGFMMVSQADTIYSPTEAANSWTVAPDNTFTVADVDGDGNNELLVQSDSAAALAVFGFSGSTWELLWTATTSGQAAGQAGLPLPSWGIGLLYGAPAIAYPSFAGDRLTVYNAVGGSVSPAVPASQTLGIRGEYTNGADVDTFSNWITNLTGQVNKTDPQWSWIDGGNWDDVTFVFKMLIGELSNLAPVMNFFTGPSTGMTYLLEMASGQRSTDLTTVNANLQSMAPSGSQPLPYWPGQLFVAVMWGLAAVPSGPEIQIPAAILASLSGAVMGANAATPNSPFEPTTLQYSLLSQVIENEYVNAQTATTAMCAVFLMDAVKMRLMTPLVQGVWAPPAAEDFTTLMNAASPYNRLQFYQMLMPTLFQVEQWMVTQQSAPWALSSGMLDEETLDLDGMGAMTYSTGSQPYNLYLPINQGTPMPSPSLPPQTLMTDLQTTMGLEIGNILTGQQGWALPSAMYSIGDPGNSSQLWVTNLADSWLWVTVYNVGLIVTCGRVNAGATGGFSFNWQHDDIVYCTLRGQLNGNAGDGFDQEVGMSPQFSNSATTATMNTYVIYSANATSGSWTNGPV